MDEDEDTDQNLNTAYDKAAYVCQNLDIITLKNNFKNIYVNLTFVLQ